MPELKLPAKLTPNQRKAYEVFSAAGIPFTQEIIGLILAADPDAASTKEAHAAAMRQADFFLRCLDDPRILVKKICKECHLPFATDYASVGFCSDECRQTAYAKIGIEFDPDKHESERYDYKIPPAVIPPAVLQKLVNLLAMLTGSPTDTSFNRTQKPKPVENSHTVSLPAALSDLF